jgi:hypothetical protein
MIMSKFKYWIVAASVALSLGIWSCGSSTTPKHSENVFENDYETLFGFNDKVEKGKAHSGECYYVIDSTVQYSMGFIKRFNKISGKKYSKVKFSAFVFMPFPQSSADMVIQVWDPKLTPLKVQSAPINGGQLGINQWKEVSLELPLATLYGPDNDVRCFFFNPTRSQLFVDDVKVEFFE